MRIMAAKAGPFRMEGTAGMLDAYADQDLSGMMNKDAVKAEEYIRKFMHCG